MGVMQNTIVKAGPAGVLEKQDEKPQKQVGKIAVVTDSTANLPRVVIEKYGITVVPINLHWGNETYKDGVDITVEEVYRRLRKTKQIRKPLPPLWEISCRLIWDCAMKWMESCPSISLRL